MTVAAGFSARTVVDVVGFMTADTGRGRVAERLICMAAGAAGFGMHAKQRKLGIRMIETGGQPRLGIVAGLTLTTQRAVVSIIVFVTAKAAGWCITEHYTILVAGAAGLLRMPSFEWEIREIMVEQVRHQAGNVSVSAEVFGMAAFTLHAGHGRLQTVKAAAPLQISRNVFMAVQTQLPLSRAIESVVTVRAGMLEFLMRLRHRSRHDQRFQARRLHPGGYEQQYQQQR